LVAPHSANSSAGESGADRLIPAIADQQAGAGCGVNGNGL